jgi:23S rRNA pseudouridine2457 synthase
LLLTTDGKKSELVRSKKVEKEYYAQIDGIIDDSSLLKLREGVEIGFKGIRYLTKPCVVKSISDPNFETRVQKIRDPKHGPTSWISVTLTEGKFRQVRKMTAAVGFPTLRLVRVRIGGHTIDSLQAGGVIEISEYLIEE